MRMFKPTRSIPARRLIPERANSKLPAMATILALIITNAVVPPDARGGDGPPFPRIANVYGINLTRDGAMVAGQQHTLEEVARCDLLIGVRASGRGPAKQELFRRQLATLKALNPNLKALHFACSAPYTHVKPNEKMLAIREAGKPFPWLLQTDGQLIEGWPGTYMLNLAFPGVTQWLAQTTLPPVRDHGYDGVFIDCLGPHFDRWACEIATGRTYSVDIDADGKNDDPKVLDKLWIKAKSDLVRQTRELLGEKPIFMANQADVSLIEQLNGIYLEDYVDAVLEGRSEFEKVLQLYRRWANTPHQPNVTVLGCSSGIEPPFEPYKLTKEVRSKYLEPGKAKLARMRFGLAATLMGDGYYSFDLNTRWRGQLWWYPEFDAPLGYPLEECRRASDGTWRRRFDSGIVVVNPTHWDVRVNLNARYRDVSSGNAGKSLVVPRQDGRILVPVATPVQVGSVADPEQQLTWDGPQGVVQRDGIVALRDGRGVAALLNESGEIQSLCRDGRELVTSIKPVVVNDSRWRNFAAEDCRLTVNSDGTLTFHGVRQFEDQRMEFTEDVALDDGRLTVRYQWHARTPLTLRAFRQSIRFSPRTFGGTSFRWSKGQVDLPAKVADDPNLAQGIKTAELATNANDKLTIHLPQQGSLIDDRFYRGSGYLLAFYPVAGEIPADREWSYSIEIDVAPH